MSDQPTHRTIESMLAELVHHMAQLAQAQERTNELLAAMVPAKK